VVTLWVIVLLALALCFIVSCANAELLKIIADKAIRDRVDLFIFISFVKRYAISGEWFQKNIAILFKIGYA